MAVNPIPEGYHTITPYLVVEGASNLIDFLKQAFGAEETFRMPMPDGKVGHAEVRIGNSMVMLGDAGSMNPAMPTMLYVYVDDADAVFKRALQAGATSTNEPMDQFWGDRSGAVKDPVGNQWWIATHKEDVPMEELAKRAQAAMQQQHQS